MNTMVFFDRLNAPVMILNVNLKIFKTLWMNKVELPRHRYCNLRSDVIPSKVPPNSKPRFCLVSRFNKTSTIFAFLVQIDLNKKREAEISKLRRDVEEANVQNEQALSSMRSKHQQALAEVQEELETFKKSKAK